jgi:hypothetical protein
MTNPFRRRYGYAFPWDVVGDPDFPGRAADLGITDVVLAATYHSTRAATPFHPKHQVVNAHRAALYRPVRPDVWCDRRLTPVTGDWVDSHDAFAESATALRAAGLGVTAWIVLTHNTRLGQAHPDVAVVNCFGDSYPYALCPRHGEVREYAATLAAEAVRGVDLDGASLEACGQMGLAHASHHEKTDGAWGPGAARLLAVCCCRACRQAWRRRGLDAREVVSGLRAAVLKLRDGEAQENASPETLLGDELAEAVLDARHAAADALRRRVLEAIPSVGRITLHGNPDPWVAAPSPGLTMTAVSDVDSILLPCWPTGPATAEMVAAARALAPERVGIGAYVTVLPPAEPAEISAHVHRVAAAGADELHLYHLGLAPPARHRLLRHFADRSTVRETA